MPLELGGQQGVCAGGSGICLSYGAKSCATKQGENTPSSLHANNIRSTEGKSTIVSIMGVIFRLTAQLLYLCS